MFATPPKRVNCRSNPLDNMLIYQGSMSCLRGRATYKCGTIVVGHNEPLGVQGQSPGGGQGGELPEADDILLIQH